MKIEELKGLLCEFLTNYTKDNGYILTGSCRCHYFPMVRYLQCSVNAVSAAVENFAYEKKLWYKGIPLHVIIINYNDGENKASMKITARLIMEELEMEELEVEV